MAVTWQIKRMLRKATQGDKSDVVTRMTWKAYESDSDGNTGIRIGQVDLELGTESFIKFADITEADAISWVKTKIGDDHVKLIEDDITAQIAEKKSPNIKEGLSW
jgi:D-serine dehydratase